MEKQRLDEAWSMYQKIVRHYNKRVNPRKFDAEDLVLKKSTKEEKLHPNWEGPFIIFAELRGGSYSSANLEGEN